MTPFIVCDAVNKQMIVPSSTLEWKHQNNWIRLRQCYGSYFGEYKKLTCTSILSFVQTLYPKYLTVLLALKMF